MCGTVGIAGTQEVAPVILEALKRLEYRGYDSAGIATLVDGAIERRRSPGKLSKLGAELHKHPLAGRTGIGHTRWATHGAPTIINAHPHANARVAIVHNGIIENFRELRTELVAKGHKFESETDSEVAVHLISDYLDQGMKPEDAAQEAVRRLTGAYSLAMIFRGEESLLIGARKGSPLAVGYGEHEAYLGSDAFALAPFTNRVAYMEDGDVAIVRGNQVSIYDARGRPANREVVITNASSALVDKAGHRHFMAKEIHEQPEVISHTLAHYLDASGPKVELDDAKLAKTLATATRLTISACGTAYYAGLVGKYWFEKFARLPVEIDFASELRYRDPVYPKDGAALFISQSGETADTLAALRDAKANGQTTLALNNCRPAPSRATPISCCRFSRGRKSAWHRPRRSRASSRRWLPLAIAAGRERGVLSAEDEKKLCTALLEIPRHIVEFLKQEAKIELLGQEVAKARDVLYLGRGPSVPARHGRRAEVERDFLHSRRGLCRRRDEARPHRVDRRRRAGDRDGAARHVLREDRLEHAGSHGARRQGAADLRSLGPQSRR